jgi:hypothetical protein
MGKRDLLFLVTNLAIMVVLSIVLSLLGFGGYLGPDGQLLIGPLMVFCFVWGMGGALISLLISRMVAKWAMGMALRLHLSAVRGNLSAFGRSLSAFRRHLPALRLHPSAVPGNLSVFSGNLSVFGRRLSRIGRSLSAFGR